MTPTVDLTEEALLDQVDALHQHKLHTEIQLLKLVAEFARQHDAGTLDPIKATLPGRQRAVHLGGEGTPMVAEFAPSVLAARLGLSPSAGGRLVADVLDLQYRLPTHWTRLVAGEVSEQHARFVARKTRHLTPEEAAHVDARIAPSADGRVSWTRFETLLEAAIVAADPAAAEAREQEAERNTFAKATRSTEHGMRGFYVRSDAAAIARIDATVAFIAEALLTLGDHTALDHRRAKAVLIMANPTQAVKILAAFGNLRDQHTAANDAADATDPERFDAAAATDPVIPEEIAELLDTKKLLPAIWLYVHLAADTDAEHGVARLEGTGPVTADWVRRHLGERCTFKITPAIDPLNQVPVDAYEIPQRHQHAVHLMTPADTFPYAANTTRQMQTDHTTPYTRARAKTGHKQSRIGNYGPMTTFHHRIKTHGQWAVRQPFPGVYLWRDPYGAIYLVDHTGTRRINHRKAAPDTGSVLKPNPFPLAWGRLTRRARWRARRRRQPHGTTGDLVIDVSAFVSLDHRVRAGTARTRGRR